MNQMTPDDARTLPRIYFAMIFGTIVYAVIAYVATQGGTRLPMAELFRNPMVIPLYAGSVVAYILSFVIPGSLARVGQPPRVVYIARWALIEAIAVFGLMLSIVLHDVRLFIAPFALAMIGFLRAYPSTDAAA